LFAVGIGVLLTALTPKQYTAKASVLLDVKSTDPIAGAAMQALAIGHYMATQADVLRSERVISSALRSLGMDQDPELTARWTRETDGQGEMIDWLAESVLKRFEVLPSRESNVITVAYSARTREDAAKIVNAILAAYVATAIDLRTEPAKQYSSFFDARAKELRLAVERAQERLSAYQREGEVVATDERLDVENNRLADLSSQLVTAQTAAAEANSRNILSSNNADSMPEVQANPMIANLRTRLSDKRLELTTLMAKYGERHPAVTALRSDIEQVRSQLDAETNKVLRGMSLNNNAIQGKAAQIQAALEAQRAKVLQLKSQRDRAVVLKRDLENAERIYSDAVSNTSRSSLESQATQTNVSILQRASVPARASSPKVIRNVAVSVFLGLLLGVATAIVRELRDRRLRSDDDVALLLGQPLFGVLPRQSTTGRHGGIAFFQLMRRAGRQHTG
ncbi:MAG: hypothetical protein K2X36_00190, partial [Microbacteriaceae bacterium]|nr:hypothetical protein [Microbacteriaceae bacterium]